jgi:hypothetical protein
MFMNGDGRPQTIRNAEAQTKTVIRHANRRLAELGIEPISERVTPHSLRRTYASMGFALGDDPVYVAEQLGHAEATFSMEIYAKAVRRRDRLYGAYLAEYDRALAWVERSIGQGMGRERRFGATLDGPADVTVPPETVLQSRKLHASPDSSAG